MAARTKIHSNSQRPPSIFCISGIRTATGQRRPNTTTENEPTDTGPGEYRSCARLIESREGWTMRESIVKRCSFAIICAVLFVGSTGLSRPAVSKAEDDFQLVNVAEGIYAAIAKPGGLASGNAGFIAGD